MEWISVKDRLPDPKEYKDVLTYEFLTHIETLEEIPHFSIEPAENIYFDDELQCVCSNFAGAENITHWMPLPEPPKE